MSFFGAENGIHLGCPFRSVKEGRRMPEVVPQIQASPMRWFTLLACALRWARMEEKSIRKGLQVPTQLLVRQLQLESTRIGFVCVCEVSMVSAGVVVAVVEAEVEGGSGDGVGRGKGDIRVIEVREGDVIRELSRKIQTRGKKHFWAPKAPFAT